MSGQLESRHYFRENDQVQHIDGYLGTVLESRALFAIVIWEDGRRAEIDQFDPSVIVLARAASE